MAKLELSAADRSTLRATAHPLKPVVLIGDKGLTEPVLKEIDLNLRAHILIKVKVSSDERATRDNVLHEICARLEAAPVHHLGKTLIIYRSDNPHLFPDITQTVPKVAAERAAKRASIKASQAFVPKKIAATGKTKKKSAAKKSLPKANDPLATLDNPRAASLTPHRSALKTSRQATSRQTPKAGPTGRIGLSRNEASRDQAKGIRRTSSARGRKG